MTPNGQAETQYPHPLQTSGCTYTDPNSVRTSAPVGQLSRQPARAQCLQTSLIISQEKLPAPVVCIPRVIGHSRKLTWRQVEEPRRSELSYDIPVKRNPSAGSWFHCLQATSQALQPMQSVVSVKKPLVPTPYSFGSSCCLGTLPPRGWTFGMSRGMSGTLARSSPRYAARRLRDLRPGTMSPVNAFDSWMCTLGSATKPMRSLAASPCTRPR